MEPQALDTPGSNTGLVGRMVVIDVDRSERLFRAQLSGYGSFLERGDVIRVERDDGEGVVSYRDTSGMWRTLRREHYRLPEEF